MRSVVVLTVVLAATSPARAEKSEKIAIALSAGGTGVSSGLVVASLLVNPQKGEAYEPLLYAGLGSSLVTPSLGQLYSEQWLTIGMGIRGAAAALALYGISQDQTQPCDANPLQNCTTLTGTGFSLIALAAIAYVGGVAFDVRDSDDAARRYNKKRSVNAALAPIAVPNGGGFGLAGSF